MFEAYSDKSFFPSSSLAIVLEDVFAWTNLSIVNEQLAVSKHVNSLLLSHAAYSRFFAASSSSYLEWFVFLCCIKSMTTGRARKPYDS